MNFNDLTLKLDTTSTLRLFFFLAIAGIVITSADYAFAAADDVIGNTLCRLLKNLTGNIAKGIAAIAIFAVGIGLFIGKLNWGFALAVALGVTIIFSAASLVSWLTTDAASATCTDS